MCSNPATATAGRNDSPQWSSTVTIHPRSRASGPDAIEWVIGSEGPGGTSLHHPTGSPPDLDFVRVDDPKVVKNRVHLDVLAPDDDVEAEAARLVALGAAPVDIGQGDVPWIVLADPEGNEFCVLPQDEI